MTTAPLPRAARPRPVLASREVALASAVTLVLGVATIAAAALLSGSAAAAGAAVGAGMVLVFFGLGALTVNAVAAVSPGASLMVALLTYVLQVLAVGVVFLVLDASGALDSRVDAEWLAGTVIAATLCWITAQVVAATRSRQPLYDLPAPRPQPSVHSTRAGAS